MDTDATKNTWTKRFDELGFKNQANIVGFKREELKAFIQKEIDLAREEGVREGGYSAALAINSLAERFFGAVENTSIEHQSFKTKLLEKIEELESTHPAQVDLANAIKRYIELK